MRDVAIIGAGVTKFGELWDKSFRALGIEAGIKAMSDANLSGSEIDGIFIGNMSAGQFIKQKHIDALIADYTGMATNHIPATRVEAGGASGGVAFRQAVMAVASGMHDVVMVGGAEKMTDMDDVSINSVLDATADAEWEAGMGVTFAGLHAMIANRMIHDGIATREEIASFSVNSHFHGALNPNAQFRKAITLDTVLKSGPTATPLGMFDCAPISDGAAGLVLCPLEDAKKYTDSYVKVSAVAQASDTLALFQRPDITTYQATVEAAKRAYEQAGITAQDIDVAEVHDTYTVTGIMALQDLGFYKRGEAGKAVLNEECHFDSGKIAINTSGGLKARGHPIGATGVAQIVEIVEQLRGRRNRFRGHRQHPGGDVMSSVAREWREVPGRYNLKGTKCANCGTIYFPRRDFCPKCRRAGIGKIEEYDICRTGEVYTYSIVYDAPAMCDMIKPYAVVMVKTDDGVMIAGQLVDVDLEKVAIGMRVRAVMRKLSTDGESGIIRYGYKFVPAE